MRLTKSMSVGAGIGFIFGIVFAVLSAFNVDEDETSVGYAIAVSLLIGMPIIVVMGTFAGWLWDIFIKGKKRPE